MITICKRIYVNTEVIFRKKTLLIVQETNLEKKVSAQHFEYYGFKTITAVNTVNALKILKIEFIDAIIAAAESSKFQGLSLLEAVKILYPKSPPVVLLMGPSQMTDAEAHKMGASALFNGPIDVEFAIDILFKAFSAGKSVLTRKYRRINASVNVLLSFKYPKLNVQSKTLNIGFGGMFVVLKDEFPDIIDEVNFKIEVVDTDLAPIEGTAVCKWRRSEKVEDSLGGMGLEFRNLNDKCMQRLEFLLNRFSDKELILKT